MLKELGVKLWNTMKLQGYEFVKLGGLGQANLA